MEEYMYIGMREYRWGNIRMGSIGMEDYIGMRG